MKRIILIAIAVVSMALTAYASDMNIVMTNANDDNTGFVAENGDHHTQEYLDYKKVLDEYEKDVKAATTCEELDGAQFGLFLYMMAYVKEEYEASEQMTDEEDRLLSAQAERIDKMIKNKQEKWDCPTDEEESPDDYERVMSALDQLETAIRNAKTCEDLNSAVEVFMEQTEEIDGSTFTEDEATAFQEKSDKVGQKLSDRADILCN